MTRNIQEINCRRENNHNHSKFSVKIQNTLNFKITERVLHSSLVWFLFMRSADVPKHCSKICRQFRYRSHFYLRLHLLTEILTLFLHYSWWIFKEVSSHSWIYSFSGYADMEVCSKSEQSFYEGMRNFFFFLRKGGTQQWLEHSNIKKIFFQMKQG